MVLSDSGGLQKEAYFFSKPCLTIREETEWVELVKSEVNKLVGSSTQKIIDGYNDFIENEVEFPESLYGDGNAAVRILDYLESNIN